MPIIHSNNIFAGLPVDVVIWHDTESEDQLITLCENLQIDHSVASKFHLAKRRKEVLIEHLLLYHLFKKNIQHTHLSNGAPILTDCHKSLSISHTKGYVVVAISDLNIGIDIELNTEKVLRVRPKFLSESEQCHLPADCITANLVAWTAKEALYKAIHVDGISFAYDIAINARGIINQDYPYSGSFSDRNFLIYSHCNPLYAITLTIENTNQ